MAEKIGKELNKGGAMLNQQMKMAFMSEGGSFPDLTGDGKVTKKDILRGRGIKGFQEGGLRDEGGTVDPVSGNDVPSGSMKEEVRDDVPAMLSEGEFVFPADVVRYIGLSKLMEMRQQAKMGLKIMEEMGQMGNSEEATLPDDFGIPDIEIIEDDDDDDDDDAPEMAQGGVIYAQEGTDDSAPFMNTPSISTPPPREPKEGFEWFATRSGWIERPIEVDKYGNPKPRLLGIDFKLVDGEWVKSGAILGPDNNTNQGPTNQQANAIGSAVGQLAGFGGGTGTQGSYRDKYGMPMLPTPPDGVKIPPQQPQQTDFERMMGYEAGRGDNPYAPSRVAYQNKKGEVVYKLEDYMGRPMESTTGLTRVTPYGPEGDQPTPAPSPDPTPDDGDSAADRKQAERKDDRKKAREAERKASRDAQIDKDIKNLQDSGDPRFVGKTGKEARDAYFDLSFKERAGMAKEDLAGRPARLKEDLDNLLEALPDAVKNIPTVISAIGNVYKDAGIELGRKAKVALGLQGEGAVERSSPPPSRPAGLGGEIDDASSLEDLQTTAQPNPFEGSTYDDISPPKPMAFGQTPVGSLPSAQFGQTPVGSLPSGPPLPDELSYTQGMQRPSVPSVQPNTTEPAFTEIKSDLPNLSQGDNTQGASRLIEGTNRKAMSDRQKRDMVRRVNSAARENDAEKKRKRNINKVDKKDRDRVRKRREEAEKKESKESKEKNKKEAANVRDYGISGLKKGGLMKKDYP